MLLSSFPAYLLVMTALTRGVVSIIIPIIKVKSRIAFILGIVYGIVGVVVKLFLLHILFE